MILIAVEKNNNVYVYDENKKLILNHQGKLHNYSEKYVAIKRTQNSEIIDIFNNLGEDVATYPYDFVDMSNVVGIDF